VGADKFPSQVLLTWAARGAAADDPGWQRALTLPERWQAPSFPLRGPDLAPFDLEGPALGERLRALEQQ
jgi:poly(A) polymerase